jgi:hypothetical protein
MRALAGGGPALKRSVPDAKRLDYLSQRAKDVKAREGWKKRGQGAK